MKSSNEMPEIIKDEMLVDCYDHDGVNMAGFYYMRENRIFPFAAPTAIAYDANA